MYGYDKKERIFDCYDWTFLKDVLFFDAPLPEGKRPSQFSPQAKKIVQDLCYEVETDQRFHSFTKMVCSDHTIVKSFFRDIQKDGVFQDTSSSISRYEKLCDVKIQYDQYISEDFYIQYRKDFVAMLGKPLRHIRFLSNVFSHAGMDDILSVDILQSWTKTQNLVLAYNSNKLIQSLLKNASLSSKEKSDLKPIISVNKNNLKIAKNRFELCLEKARGETVSGAKKNTRSYFASQKAQEQYIERQCSGRSESVSSQGTHIISTHEKYSREGYKVDDSAALEEFAYRKSELRFCQLMATAKGCYEHNNSNYNFEEGMKIWRNCGTRWCW